MKRIIVTAAAAVVVFSAGLTGSSGAQQTPPETGIPPVGKKVEEISYQYDETGRRDPFVSLIKPEVADTGNRDETLPLPPLEKFDISQMKLVAVVWTDTGYHGLVKLPDNKYFMVEEGMILGIKRGEIVDISETMLVVKETETDYKGRVREREVILKLRLEEEDNAS